MRRFIELLGMLAAALTSWNLSFAVEAHATEDVVMITGIAPASVVSGEEVEVAVKVAYALRTYESGAIRLTANTLAPNGDRRIASVGIKRGMGEATLQAKIVPRYWSETVPFGVNAVLVVADGDDLQTMALSVDHANFDIAPATKERPADFWPAVRDTYVDGVSIIKITPDTFEEGIEQEIVVKVKYELLSREEAAIKLGVSDGRPATRQLIGVTRVKIGKGEAEVRARFVPKKTAELPVGRLLIALHEFPDGKPAVPLASDEATITVK